LGEWAATSNGEPITSRDPFLHGIREPDDDVSIVWRADLDDIDAGSWQLLVDRLPPMADEQLDVPIGAALRWLRGEPGAADVADAPGVEGRGDEVTDGVPTIRTEVLVWRGRGDGIVVDRASRLRTIRPGDVLVVPAVAGGCDGEGWFPTSTAAVPDLADEKGRSLRLHPATLPSFLGLPADEVAPVLDELWDSLQDDELDAIDAVATALAEVGLSDEGFVGTPDVLRGADGGVLGVYLDRPLDDAARRRMLGDGSVAQPDAAESSAAGASVALTVHHDAVAARARSIAQALRLPAVLAESVAVAAGAHDLGKWDPRFQVMLHAGDAAASKASLDGGRPLAKSGMRADDRTVARIAHRASGLPRGYRHEAGSVQAAGSVLERDDVDRDLVRHLIAAHHGNARPLLPAVLDEGAPFDADGIEVDPGRSVDFEHPRRFRELSDRYGHWGLAMLEAIVRLSDIGCSEEGS
jgi:CRISPR-associated endonuclease/helicase Cas3